MPGSPPAASPDMSRYVFAPIRTVYSASGWSPNQARYSGPSRPHQPGQPSAAPYPSSEVMKSIMSSGICDSFRPFLASLVFVRPDRRTELIGRATISMPMDGLFVIAKARNKPTVFERLARDVDRLLRRHDEQAQV